MRHPLFLLTTIGILLEAIFLFITYYEFCLERLVWFEYFLVLLCVLSWILAGYTYLRETKLCHDLLELLSMLQLNLYDLWNCSSASLLSFWARCALVFLKKCSHASLKLIWEKEIIMLMVFTYICLSLSKATHEN